MNSQLKRFLERLSSTVIGCLLAVVVLKLIGSAHINYFGIYIGASLYNMWMACKDQNYEK